MSVSQLVCPNCHSALSIQKAVPAGIDILCPTCKKFFKAPTLARTMPSNGDEIRRDRHEAVFDRSAGSPPTTSTGRLALLAVGALCLSLGAISLLLLWVPRGADKEQERVQVEKEQNGPAIIFPKLTPGKLKSARPASEIGNLTGKEKSEVDEIVRRGVEFLKRTQNPDGTWPNPDYSGPDFRPYFAALAGLTLLECGVSPKDPVIQKAAAVVRGDSEGSFTYGVSLYLLFLHKLNEPQDKGRIKSIALRFIAAQSVNGSWNYSVPALTEEQQAELFQLLTDMGNKDSREFAKTNAQRLAASSPFIRNLAIFFPWEEQNADFFKMGDNSTTQFAILALGAAQEHKLPVDHSLALIARRFRLSQEKDGRWYYSPELKEPHPGPSMTCVGLLGLAGGYGVKVPMVKVAENPLDDPAIKKGLEYVANFVGEEDKREDARPPQVHTYYLWSLQRVAVLFKLERIGQKDWYRWGKQVFKTHQRADGSWAFRREPAAGWLGWDVTPDTCFALLFLQRVNLSQGFTDKFETLLAASEEGKKD